MTFWKNKRATPHRRCLSRCQRSEQPERPPLQRRETETGTHQEKQGRPGRTGSRQENLPESLTRQTTRQRRAEPSRAEPNVRSTPHHANTHTTKHLWSYFFFIILQSPDEQIHHFRKEIDICKKIIIHFTPPPHPTNIDYVQKWKCRATEIALGLSVIAQTKQPIININCIYYVCCTTHQGMDTTRAA